jgi:DNA-directed RNA polymerase subunit RPC12/RpoP
MKMKIEWIEKDGVFTPHFDDETEKLMRERREEFLIRWANRERKPPRPKQSEEEKREKRKEYRSRPEVKEHRAMYDKIYHIEHKEERQKYHQEYIKRNELKGKVECECGSKIAYRERNKHYKTKKHLEFLEKKNE